LGIVGDITNDPIRIDLLTIVALKKGLKYKYKIKD
jgi:hypothetical protein